MGENLLNGVKNIFTKEKSESKLELSDEKELTNPLIDMTTEASTTNLSQMIDFVVKEFDYTQSLPPNFVVQEHLWQKENSCFWCKRVFQKINFNKNVRRTHCRKCCRSVCGYCCSTYVYLS